MQGQTMKQGICTSADKGDLENSPAGEIREKEPVLAERWSEAEAVLAMVATWDDLPLCGGASGAVHEATVGPAALEPSVAVGVLCHSSSSSSRAHQQSTSTISPVVSSAFLRSQAAVCQPSGVFSTAASMSIAEQQLQFLQQLAAGDGSYSGHQEGAGKPRQLSLPNMSRKRSSLCVRCTRVTVC